MSKAEAIAFHEDHNRYQAAETRADNRAAWVKDRVNQLMKPGEECDPFTPDHVQEAIAQLEFADTLMLGAYVKSAFNLPDNTSAQVYLADFITDRVQDYWHKMAVWQAEKEYDSRID